MTRSAISCGFGYIYWKKFLTRNFIFYAVPQSQFPQYSMKLKLGVEVATDRRDHRWSFISLVTFNGLDFNGQYDNGIWHERVNFKTRKGLYKTRLMTFTSTFHSRRFSQNKFQQRYPRKTKKWMGSLNAGFSISSCHKFWCCHQQSYFNIVLRWYQDNWLSCVA